MESVEYRVFLENVRHPDVKTEFLIDQLQARKVNVDYRLCSRKEFERIQSEADYIYGDDKPVDERVAVIVTADNGDGYYVTIRS